MKPFILGKDAKTAPKSMPDAWLKLEAGLKTSTDKLRSLGGVCYLLSYEAMERYWTSIKQESAETITKDMPALYELFLSVTGPLISEHEIVHDGLDRCKLHKLKHGIKPEKFMILTADEARKAVKKLCDKGLPFIPTIQGYHLAHTPSTGRPEDALKSINFKHDYEYTLYYLDRAPVDQSKDVKKGPSSNQATSRYFFTTR